MDKSNTENYINPDLKFLLNRNVIYYAGLDIKAFPGEQGAETISRIGNKNLTYIKLLSLFVDNIIIPPTFFIDTLYNNAESVRYLAPLFQSNLIISSIDSYSKNTLEFLDKKMRERKLLETIPASNYKILKDLFYEIPVVKRNVKVQSGGFKNKLVSNLKLITNIPSQIVEELISSINNLENKTGLVLSRRDAINYLTLYREKFNLSQQTYNQFFYLFNEAYYSEGGTTYFANVSLINSERYSTLYQNSINNNSSRILFGYDPELILNILKGFLISEEHINNLTVENILEIKNTNEFIYFVNRFKIFVDLIQKLSTNYSRLSEKSILLIKQEILTKFNAEYRLGLKFINKNKHHFGFAEAASWSILTGTLGFFIIPLYGALLGLVPALLYKTKFSQRTVDLILNRIYSGEAAFYNYIELLSENIFEFQKEE